MMRRNDGHIRAAFLLGALTLLVAVVLLEHPSILPGPRSADALENPVESRQQMVTELQQLNQKMDRLLQLFESGKVKVVVANADELKADAAPAVAPAEKNNGVENKIVIKRKGE